MATSRPPCAPVQTPRLLTQLGLAAVVQNLEYLLLFQAVGRVMRDGVYAFAQVADALRGLPQPLPAGVPQETTSIRQLSSRFSDILGESTQLYHQSSRRSPVRGLSGQGRQLHDAVEELLSHPEMSHRIDTWVLIHSPKKSRA